MFDDEQYNRDFLQSAGLIDSPMQIYPNRNADGTVSQTVWLQNIDRVLEMYFQDGNETPEKQAQKVEFVDLGSGSGLALIYVAHRYKFRRVTGYELNPNVANLARQNVREAKRNLGIKEAPEVFVRDVASLSLPCATKTLFFLFNPFGPATFTDFIEKNLPKLNKSQSSLLLVNDNLREEAGRFSTLRIRNPALKLSIFDFQEDQSPPARF